MKACAFAVAVELAPALLPPPLAPAINALVLETAPPCRPPPAAMSNMRTRSQPPAASCEPSGLSARQLICESFCVTTSSCFSLAASQTLRFARARASLVLNAAAFTHRIVASCAAETSSGRPLIVQAASAAAAAAATAATRVGRIDATVASAARTHIVG